MGNKSSDLSESTYQNKLARLNDLNHTEAKDIAEKHGKHIMRIWHTDVLQILISFCDRTEQYILINLMTNNMNLTQDDLSQIIQYNKIQIKPSIDSYLIRDFNKSQSTLSTIEVATFFGFKFFFNNIVLNGKPHNIKYLIANKNNIVFGFMYYICAKKGGKKEDILKRENTNVTLQIDRFVEAHKSQQAKHMMFDVNDVFHSEDEKLDNIKYKNVYQFDQYQRESQINAYKHLSWQQLNNIYLRYLVTNQLNHCMDGKQKQKNKDINEEIDINLLDVLCGFTFFDSERGLIGYNLQHQISKHVAFVGARNQYHVKSKKVYVTSKKTSSIFLFPQRIKDDDDVESIGIHVITMINPESQEHIQDKGKSVGKKIIDDFAYSAAMALH